MSPAPGSADAQVSMYGLNFGDEELALSQGWSPAELAVGGQVGSTPCDAVLRSRQNETGGTFTVLTCSFSTANLACGYSNFTVSIAGQAGFAPAQPTYLKVNGAGSQFQPLLLVCDVNFYGHLGETCLPCPAQVPATPILTGAYCAGYRPYSSASNPIDPAAFTYPVPLAGNYNLNSSDTNTLKWGAPGESQMEACPSGFQQQQGGRDVCIVQCTNTAACLGNNLCAYGYASKPPLWACSYCDTGFYESAGSCIKCPDSPYALIIGFCLLVVVAGCIGYFMNQKGVNIAVVSIGLDFFQVLAIFATAGVKWPPVILQLFQVLSAFNLNIQIVAPDCIVPNITYKQEFWFIMLLPLLVGSVFGLIFLGIFAHKALVMGVAKKDWFTHRPALVASGLALVYILYLYLTRTVFDIFNCNPKPVPDGCLHLNVAHGECCGVPGGTQLTLLPYAIAGLIVYSFGYPAFIGYTIYKNRELAMLDQLLKAKGTGDDKLSNPLAYDLRMTYGRSYFQFKPDFCMWILAIICRKFFIAITGAVFGKNSSFQMAACLMIMFLAYSAQMIFRPYMNSGEFEDVLKSHAESAFTSVLHARIRTHIANIETRGRKKARKNLLNFEGKVDRSAVLGLLTSWLFNYNTIEQIMLFCAVIVCLMGIMYQANASDTFQGANDGVTAVVMITIIFACVPRPTRSPARLVARSPRSLCPPQHPLLLHGALHRDRHPLQRGLARAPSREADAPGGLGGAQGPEVWQGHAALGHGQHGHGPPRRRGGRDQRGQGGHAEQPALHEHAGRRPPGRRRRRRRRRRQRQRQLRHRRCAQHAPAAVAGAVVRLRRGLPGEGRRAHERDGAAQRGQAHADQVGGGRRGAAPAARGQEIRLRADGDGLLVGGDAGRQPDEGPPVTQGARQVSGSSAIERRAPTPARLGEDAARPLWQRPRVRQRPGGRHKRGGAGRGRKWK